MDAPSGLPQSLRSRLFAAVVEALFIGYLAAGLSAAAASALLVAQGCRLAFDLWFGFSLVIGALLQVCKLGLLLYAGDTEGRLTAFATGLLLLLSLLASTAALADALVLKGFAALATGLLVAGTLEATVACLFLSLRQRASTALAESDVLDKVAHYTAAALRRQEGHHVALRNEVHGQVGAIRGAMEGIDGRTRDENDLRNTSHR